MGFMLQVNFWQSSNAAAVAAFFFSRPVVERCKTIFNLFRLCFRRASKQQQQQLKSFVLHGKRHVICATR